MKFLTILFGLIFLLASCNNEGCTFPQADNYDPNATIDDGSCYFGGCTDENADNYNPMSTYNNGSCTYSSDLILWWNESKYEDWRDNDGIDSLSVEIDGAKAGTVSIALFHENEPACENENTAKFTIPGPYWGYTPYVVVKGDDGEVKYQIFPSMSTTECTKRYLF